jgi:hypothetical protein
MCQSDHLKKFLERVMSEDDPDDRGASKADRKCKKIYDRIKVLVHDREELKQEIKSKEDSSESLELQLRIAKIDREFNDLLNVLSMDSMEF